LGTQGHDIWPVQKFNWRDFAATRGQTNTYDVVPMTGQIPTTYDLISGADKLTSMRMAHRCAALSFVGQRDPP